MPCTKKTRKWQTTPGMRIVAGLSILSAAVSPTAQAAPFSENWAVFAGTGYSGSTFGRQIPGLHLGLTLYGVEATVFSTGVSSELERSTHQNYSLGYTLLKREASVFQLHSSVGVGYQHNQRQSSQSPTDTTAGGNTVRMESDSTWGPSFAVQGCFFGTLCLRVEALFGWSDHVLDQIYHENALGSIGVQL